MNIDDALKGLSNLYIETAPLIYYVEEHPVYVEKMDAIITALESNTIAAVTSVITLTEVLTQPIKVQNTRLQQEYKHILLNSKGLSLLPITSPIAETAAELRAQYHLRTPDALHVAAAMVSNCDAFLTNDLAMRRVTELSVLVLDELQLPATGG